MRSFNRKKPPLVVLSDEAHHLADGSFFSRYLSVRMVRTEINPAVDGQQVPNPYHGLISRITKSGPCVGQGRATVGSECILALTGEAGQTLAERRESLCVKVGPTNISHIHQNTPTKPFTTCPRGERIRKTLLVNGLSDANYLVSWLNKMAPNITFLALPTSQGFWQHNIIQNEPFLLIQRKILLTILKKNAIRPEANGTF